jgi:hypothetical protein
MLRAPPFPALDDWQRMSEPEQDALLARMEAARRRNTLGLRCVLGLGAMAIAAALAWTLLPPL